MPANNEDVAGKLLNELMLAKKNNKREFSISRK